MNKLKTLLLLLLLALSGKAFATHLAGGEIRYEYNGTNYTIYLLINSDCSGATMGNTQIVNLSSVSTSGNFNVTCSLQTSYVTPACASTQNKCQNPMALLPGFKTWVYTATTNIAPASDWIIGYNAGARSPAYNISGMGNFNIEARLDNNSAINSSPLVTGHLVHMAINNTPVIVPLQAADAEADDIQYEIVAPMSSAGVNVPFAPGYSVTNTLGASGVCSVNNTNKTLTMMTVNSGTYAVAIKVKEYRNSNLVASYMREIVLMSLPAMGPATVTLPMSSSNFNYFTCPGQSNSVTLNFTDAAGDSIFLTPTFPTITGFSFGHSTTSGPGTGSITMTWTTPTTMNPATLPYFFVKVNAADNGCPKQVLDYHLVVRTQQCASDSVWPGDANGDYTVNIYDPLAIAIANGQTGPTRTGATTTWTAQPCANWTNSFLTNNVNMKHADCDGNGTVNTTDLGAITTNWGLTHPKGNHQNKVTGAPPLFLDITGITLKPGATVTIPVKFGEAANPMNGIYGLATKITVNGITMGAPSINSTGSWIGSTSNSLSYSKMATTNAQWAHARTDHQNINGNGKIGELKFTVPANAVAGTPVVFTFSMTKVIDKDGNEITNFDEIELNTIIAFPDNIADVSTAGLSAIIAPNPSAANAELRIALPADASVKVNVTDLTGKVLWNYSAACKAGNSTVTLPANFAPGLYLVEVGTGDAATTETIKWIRQ